MEKEGIPRENDEVEADFKIKIMFMVTRGETRKRFAACAFKVYYGI